MNSNEKSAVMSNTDLKNLERITAFHNAVGRFDVALGRLTNAVPESVAWNSSRAAPPFRHRINHYSCE
ncbi:MAG TPA: hypothetical protein VFZ09_48145 [Archangium sp.]|uniref:hypothetical protein n=1 Tax=Archangium sp. TaxID=1872627 RepID=UPI002E337519|nr:hypothetical protein [Archangium sp.]HEX5754049.1 hypothetical protein [Archangium sp.]